MIKCWASVLGGCDRQSKEHYLSRSLWTNNELVVTVSCWNAGKPKQINIKSLWNKMLCVKHNNQLSPLDREAGSLFRGIETVTKRAEQVSIMRRTSLLSPISYEANGNLIERWLFKLVIGTLIVMKINGEWAISGTPLIEPPENIVKMIFGILPINKPFGTYAILNLKDNLAFTESVRFSPYVNDEDKYIGALVYLRTLPFIVWMDSSEIDKRLETFSSQFLEPESVTESYHFEEITFTAKGKIASRLRFRWN